MADKKETQKRIVQRYINNATETLGSKLAKLESIVLNAIDEIDDEKKIIEIYQNMVELSVFLFDDADRWIESFNKYVDKQICKK